MRANRLLEAISAEYFRGAVVSDQGPCALLLRRRGNISVRAWSRRLNGIIDRSPQEGSPHTLGDHLLHTLTTPAGRLNGKAVRAQSDSMGLVPASRSDVLSAEGHGRRARYAEAAPVRSLSSLLHGFVSFAEVVGGRKNNTTAGHATALRHLAHFCYDWFAWPGVPLRANGIVELLNALLPVWCLFLALVYEPPLTKAARLKGDTVGNYVSAVSSWYTSTFNLRPGVLLSGTLSSCLYYAKSVLDMTKRGRVPIMGDAFRAIVRSLRTREIEFERQGKLKEARKCYTLRHMYVVALCWGLRSREYCSSDGYGGTHNFDSYDHLCLRDVRFFDVNKRLMPYAEVAAWVHANPGYPRQVDDQAIRFAEANEAGATPDVAWQGHFGPVGGPHSTDIFIGSTKVDRFGEGSWRSAGRSGHAWVCPTLDVAAFVVHQVDLGCSLEGPLFHNWNHPFAKNTIVTSTTLRACIKADLTRVVESGAVTLDFPLSRYGTHSFRKAAFTIEIASRFNRQLVAQRHAVKDGTVDTYAHQVFGQESQMAHAVAFSSHRIRLLPRPDVSGGG